MNSFYLIARAFESDNGLLNRASKSSTAHTRRELRIYLRPLERLPVSFSARYNGRSEYRLDADI